MKLINLFVRTSARRRTRADMSEWRRSHFFLFPFFFLLFLDFLRPPGMTGLIEGFLVGDGFVGGAAAAAVAGAETSAVEKATLAAVRH